MIEQSEVSFAGYGCIRLSNGLITLWITRAVGPRIIGLSVAGGANLFAVVPDAVVTTPAGRRYQLRGGHRLWHAPEDPERTYLPDDQPLLVTPHLGGLELTQPVEPATGIEKQISLTLIPDEPALFLVHTLTNHGSQPIEVAPWAITQLRPGGFAILPHSGAATGLLPNRRFALWPYSRASAPQLHWGDRYIFYRANMTTGSFKLGWANPDGWMAYWIDRTLFVKQAPYLDGARYPDFGSSGECYCDPRFLELESLGPLTILPPGERVHHEERWRLYSGVAMEPEEAQIAHWVERLGIQGFETG